MCPATPVLVSSKVPTGQPAGWVYIWKEEDRESWGRKNQESLRFLRVGKTSQRN